MGSGSPPRCLAHRRRQSSAPSRGAAAYSASASSAPAPGITLGVEVKLPILRERKKKSENIGLVCSRFRIKANCTLIFPGTTGGMSKWDFSFSISIHIARCHFGCTKVRTATSNSRKISCTTVRLLSLTSNFCGLDFSDQTPCPAEKTSISSSKTYHLTMSSHDAIIAPPPSYVDELLS